jgi:hypothetical protein
MRTMYIFTVVLLAITVLTGLNLQAQDQQARLQVIHNAADPAAASVDVYVNGDLLLNGFNFREATPFIDVPAGVELNIGVAAAGSNSAADTLKNFAVTFADGGTYVAIANGVLDPGAFTANPDGVDIAFTLFAKADAHEASTEIDEVQFIAVHGATDAPAVDILARNVGALVNGAFYGAITDYLSVPASYYTIDITPAGANEIIVASFGADLRGLAGQAITVLASGFLTPGNNQNGEAFTLIAVFADGTVVTLPFVEEFEANLSGLNEVPPVLTNGMGTVSLTLAGNVVQLNGMFTNLTDEYTMSHIHVGSAGINGGVVVGLTAELDAQMLNGQWIAAQNTFDLTENQVQQMRGGEYYINLHTRAFPAGEIRGQILASPNGAPSASKITFPPDGAELTIEGEANSPFVPTWSSAIDPDDDKVVYIWQLAADEAFNTILVNANTGTDTAFQADFRAVDGLLAAAGLNIGDSVTLYHRALSSDGSNVTFGTAKSVELTRSVLDYTARLQVIHNAADPAAASVDVWVNDIRLLNDFGFRQATPFIDAPAETEITIDITPAGDTTVVTSFTVTLSDGGSYIAIANGVLGLDQFAANPDGIDIEFTLYVVDYAQEASTDENEVQLFVFHGSTDAPAVDVIARDVALLVENAAYGDGTSYFGVPGAEYILDITPAGDNETIVASFSADLQGLEGGALAVLASGFLSPDNNQDGPAFGLIAVLPDGTVAELQTYVKRYEVTFNVDMSNAMPFNPDTDDVYLAGSLAGWLQPGTDTDLRMVPTDGDPMIYTLTLYLEAGEYQYKYFRVANNNPSWDNGEWPGDPNRVINVIGDRVKNDVWGQRPTSTARVQVIHNAADPAAAMVDIYVNGDLFLNDFGFRSATPFVNVPAEVEINLGIAPANSESVNDVLVEFEGIFGDNETYVVIANGVLSPDNFAGNPDGVDIEFTLFTKTNARETAKDENLVEFFIVHGSTDAPAVDIAARAVAVLATNVPYGGISPYLGVPENAYVIDILPAGGNNPVASFDLDLSGLAGGSAVVLASGFFTPAANQDGAGFVLIAVLADGTVLTIPTDVRQLVNDLPLQYTLSQNYPNPFNPTTTINFVLPTQSIVTLEIYNAIGQKIATLISSDELSAGQYDIVWNGRDDAGRQVSSGMYIYRLSAGDFQATRSMIMLK